MNKDGNRGSLVPAGESRQRVHDLLSARKLRRFKDGGRTLVLRGELEQYVAEVE